ncbi:DUF6308 family protein [Brevibacterium senegalense]|uniref:DUF6308 family protein n=1 Tax=Brevibacterium senegalense TaxID=1033736 RepID=UPI00036AA993|nr:DUF6308 family protein [Brevibacterium senegalense]
MTILEAAKTITRDQVQEWTETYFGLRDDLEPYTGAYFNTLAAEETDPNRFTAGDLYALRCLAVDVPVKVGICILETHADDVNALLRQIPSDIALADVTDEEYDSLLGIDSPAWQLWRRLRAGDEGMTRWGMGPTRVSKLMARKRPHLIPIEVSVVNRVIGSNARNSWHEWRTALHSDREALHELADEVRSAAKRPDLSTLRALDIVQWMKGKSDQGA